MIRSWKHKGLQLFFMTGSLSGIIPQHASKIARILDRLDMSLMPEDMNLPGYRLHKLHGNESEIWSVAVNGNWRITFSFQDHDAYLVDYRDYH